MPSLFSLTQSTIAHALVAAFVIWAAGMKLDSMLNRSLEKLQQKQLIPAELVDIVQPNDERPPQPTVADKPAASDPTKPDKSTAPAAPEPAPAPTEAPDSSTAEQFAPTETEANPIEYAGNSSRTAAHDKPSDSNSTMAPETATETPVPVPVPFTSEPPVALSGQLVESGIQDSGLQAPRLRMRLDNTLIDALLMVGAARILVESPVNPADPTRLVLSGTTKAPEGWEPLTETHAEKLSDRGLKIQQPQPALSTSLNSWGLGREHSQQAAFWLMFTHEFDRYILKQQLAAVRHLPPEERPMQTTAIEIRQTPDGSLVATAHLEKLR